VIEDQELAAQLPAVVLALLDDPARLETMREKMRLLAHPQAAGAIADLLVELAGDTGRMAGSTGRRG